VKETQNRSEGETESKPGFVGGPLRDFEFFLKIIIRSTHIGTRKMVNYACSD